MNTQEEISSATETHQFEVFGDANVPGNPDYYVAPSQDCGHPGETIIGQAWRTADVDGDGDPEVQTLDYAVHRCGECGAQWTVTH